MAGEVIFDELRMFPDRESFRLSLIGLDALYGETRFAQGLRKNADNMRLTQAVLTDSHLNPNDSAFYHGSLMGMHCIIVTLHDDYALANKLSKTQPGVQGMPIANFDYADKEHLKAVLGYRESMSDRLEISDDHVIEPLVEAGLVYAQNQHEKDEFILGIFYSMELSIGVLLKLTDGKFPNHRK